MTPKPTVEELIDIYGGPIDTAILTNSVRRDLEHYTMMARINPTVVLKPGGGTGITPPSSFASIHFVRKWTANAVVALTREAPVLIVYAATPLILHVYFQRLLACPFILQDFDAKSEIWSGGRWSLDFDYEGILSGKYSDEIPLTREDAKQLGADDIVPGAAYHVDWRYHVQKQPRSEMRRELIIHLVGIVCNFLFTHEFEHVDGGHLQFTKNSFGISSLSEFGLDGVAKSEKIDRNTLYSLEILADEAAARKSFLLSVSDSPLKGSMHDNFQKSLSYPQRVRLWLFAITAFFCLLGLNMRTASPIWKWIPVPGRSSSHPNSFLRLFAVVSRISQILGDAAAEKVAFQKGWDMSLKDLMTILRLTRREHLWNDYISSSNGSDFKKICDNISRLVPKLELAQAEISQEYFYRGERVKNMRPI